LDTDLFGNALADVLNYRFYVIYHMPWLKLLDCHEVNEEQRIKAKRLFGTADENAKTISNTAFGFTYRPGGALAPTRRLGQTAVVEKKEDGPSLYDDLCKSVDVRICLRVESTLVVQLELFFPHLFSTEYQEEARSSSSAKAKGILRIQPTGLFTCFFFIF
jgi:hypothetical protein